MGSDYWDYNFFDYGDYNFFDYGDYDDSKSGGIGGLGLDYSYDADWWMNNFLDDVDYHKVRLIYQYLLIVSSIIQ